MELWLLKHALPEACSAQRSFPDAWAEAGMQSLPGKVTFTSKGAEPQTPPVPVRITGSAQTGGDRSKKILLPPHKGQSLTIPCSWRTPELLLEPMASTKSDMNCGCFTLQALNSNIPGIPKGISWQSIFGLLFIMSTVGPINLETKSTIKPPNLANVQQNSHGILPSSLKN